MPHNFPNKNPNKFGCHMFTEEMSTYIPIQEMAQIWIPIIWKDHFILIFEYTYSSLIVVTLE